MPSTMPPPTNYYYWQNHWLKVVDCDPTAAQLRTSSILRTTPIMLLFLAEAYFQFSAPRYVAGSVAVKLDPVGF